MSEILKGKTILIVEDEIDLREPLAFELESWGCHVLQSENGVKGLELAKTHKIDAILSDIRMPGGDGITLLRNIKAMNHEFPVVMFITGFSDLSLQQAYHMGAEAMLAKPFSLDEMVAAVIRILTPREARFSKKVEFTSLVYLLELEFHNLHDAIRDGHLGIGRGGLFVRASSQRPAPEAPITFNIRFTGGEILSIQGDGVVRWVRHAAEGELPPGYGFEFHYLSDAVRYQVLALTNKLRVLPYIPNNAYPGKTSQDGK